MECTSVGNPYYLGQQMTSSVEKWMSARRCGIQNHWISTPSVICCVKFLFKTLIWLTFLGDTQENKSCFFLHSVVSNSNLLTYTWLTVIFLNWKKRTKMKC